MKILGSNVIAPLTTKALCEKKSLPAENINWHACPHNAIDVSTEHMSKEFCAALLTAGILLILTEYELHEKRQKANLDIGRELSCNHEVPV